MFVYYPGTRRVIPGPVTTRSGTGITGTTLPARRLDPGTDNGYPVVYVSLVRCVSPVCTGPGLWYLLAVDTRRCTTLVQTLGYAQM